MFSSTIRSAPCAERSAQADAQLALARNQLILAQTQASIRRSALAEYTSWRQ